MRAAVRGKSKQRTVHNVIGKVQRVERARLRAQIRHNREMRDLARRLKATLTQTDLALKGFVRDVAPALGLTVIDRVEWERTEKLHQGLRDELEEAQHELRELRVVRCTDTEQRV